MDELAKISKYPKFEPLELSHKTTIQSFTSQFEPYSDFNFTSLYCWDTDGLTTVSNLNENLVIRIPDYLTGKPSYSILGNNLIDESILELLKITKKLKLVPHIVKQNINAKENFKIELDRDGSDYIYDISALAGFKGGKYKKKRNKANKYIKGLKTQSAKVEILEELSRERITDLKDLCTRWIQEASRDEGDFVTERKAIVRLFDNFADLDPKIIAVLIDGKIKAFSVNEVVGEGYASCLFEKAVKDSGEHIYPYLVGETAKVLQDLGCSYVSWMQDLGLEGLRKSKMSYHPQRMLKKYTVREG